jgi:EAL domain-containing protein (putative c-di-GMP-specific phosphodiesterase class I)
MASPNTDTALATLLEAFGGLRPVFQPVVNLTTGQPVSYEALARFGSGASPEAVFREARRIGLGPQLEAHAAGAALATGEPPAGTRLSINFSPTALASVEVMACLPTDLGRVIIEVTENELVTHQDLVVDRLAELRRRGAEIAVDDAGAGYASLRQVMHLRPEVIKLDRSLVTGAHADPAKRALIDAFVGFARRIGGRVCAEGIEMLEELRTLADLDVGTGQGWVFARPGTPWPAVDATAAAACVACLERALAGAGMPQERDTDVTLETVGRVLASCGTLDDLDGCLASTASLLDVPEICISRVVDLDGAPGVEVCAGGHWDTQGSYALGDYPATEHALATNEALQVLVSDPSADDAEVRHLLRHGYGALLLVPLVRRGRPVGLIEAYSREERPWSRRQIRLARAVGHQLAVALPHLGRASDERGLRSVAA